MAWRNDSGFTLIEMLVVAAIIGVLAGLAVPNYFLFKGNALDSAASSGARNIAPAAELVASEGGLDTLIVLDGTGGPIAELPGAVASRGLIGTIDVGGNRYTIDVECTGGNLHYRLDSEAGWTVSPS